MKGMVLHALRTSLLALIFTASSWASPTEAGFSELDLAHATLLTRATTPEVTLAGKSLHHFGSADSRIFDIAAEVLWRACSGSRAPLVDADAQAWLAKALGKSGNGRYRVLLSSCAAVVKDDETKEHIEKNIALLPASSAEPFKQGTVDLEALSVELRAATRRPPRSDGEFFRLQAGDTLQSVYRRLGAPDKLEAVEVRGANKGWGLIKIQTEFQMILATYTGLGTVRFDLQEKRNTWAVDVVNATAANPPLGDAHLHFQIATAGSEALKPLLNDLAKRGRLERNLLDRLAQRVSDSRYTPDHYLAGSLVSMCKIVLKSADGRYKAIMSDISVDAASRGLRKLAGQVAERLPRTDESPFVAAPRVSESAIIQPSAASAGAPPFVSKRMTEPPVAPAANLAPSPEERLKTLKRAYEQGLITKEEYDAKRKGILEEL